MGFRQYLKVFDAEVQLADLHHQCRRHKLLGGPGTCSPWKVFKIGLSKMQFSAFPGPELINWEGVLRHYEMLTNNEIFVFVIFIIILQVFSFFLVDSKMSSRKMSVRIPENRMVYRRTLHVKQPDIASGIWPEAKPLEVLNSSRQQKT